MTNKRNGIVVYLLLIIAAFSFRFAVARLLPNDAPFDGVVYAQIARNVLEQHVYSHATAPPFQPSIIRLPGYPLFLAGIYSIFGHGNNAAVRVVQAFIDTLSCVLIGLIAFYWEPDERLKRRTATFALLLGAVCPFTTIYVATILTEIPTILFALGACLTATLAFKARRRRDVLLLWGASGLLVGIAVLLRPDAGLFAAAIGLTLVLTTLKGPSEETSGATFSVRATRALLFGLVLSLGFCLALVPWTIRNRRVFHVFQPLAPSHAEMPGEFVPRGYLAWVRTWIDDSRYIGPVIWTLEEAPIKLEEFPDQAFDSAEEKARVAALLDKYNHPQGDLDQTFEPTKPEDEADDNAGEDVEAGNEKQNSSGEPGQKDNADEEDEDDSADENAPSDQPVEMTPEIDNGFAQIARERISRHPIRNYLLLPAKRAATLWFDTHSQYYPFEGELFPLGDLDHIQRAWLPLFAALTLIYSLLGVVAAWFLWRSKQFDARRWLLLAALVIILRIAFFSTLENPEPRYVVEVFPFLSILGGIALTRLLTSPPREKVEE